MSTEDDETLTSGEWMTFDQVAAYTGRDRRKIGSWLSRFAVQRQMMARTEDVVAAKASMPGTGRRRVGTTTKREG